MANQADRNDIQWLIENFEPSSGDWIQIDRDGNGGENGYDGYAFASFLELE